MPADNDKPLPVAFWSEPVEGTRKPEPPAPAVVPEIETWRASFELLGTNVEAAMTEHYGKLNQHGVVMHTFEQVYSYMRSLDRHDAPAEPQVAPAPAPQDDARAEKRQRKLEFDMACDRWHKAVADRRTAMQQWDAYVAATRAEMQALKANL